MAGLIVCLMFVVLCGVAAVVSVWSGQALAAFQMAGLAVVFSCLGAAFKSGIYPARGGAK